MNVDAILFDGEEVYDLVAGDVDVAHREGMKRSKEIYGVTVTGKADIVIAEAYPTDIDLRQAIKAICSADLVCKDGGVIILPSECPDGVAPQFPDFEAYGFKDPDALFQKVESGAFQQKLLAYTLVAVGRIISKRVRAILVSPGINPFAAYNMGFLWAQDLETSVKMALDLTQHDASIVVLKQAGEILPLLV
jgi:nickel-dependent lactate racemase